MIVIVLPDIAAEDFLLAQAKQGNDEALRDIYQQYFTPVYQYIRLRVDNKQEAEDLASEVFFKMIKAFRGRHAPRHSLRGWLFKTALHVIFDHYGSRQKFTTEALDDWLPADTDPDPETQFIRKLDIQRAQMAMRRLSLEQQEVLILRFGQMLSLKETADIMGKQVNAIKALQLRAINSLRRILAEMRMEFSHG